MTEGFWTFPLYVYADFFSETDLILAIEIVGSIVLQTVHFLVILPFEVRVALTTDLEYLWPRALTLVWATITVLQTEQCLPLVRPVFVQVALISLSITALCSLQDMLTMQSWLSELVIYGVTS